MAGFRLTQRAEQDMEAIGRYTEEQWGRDQRNRYLTDFDASFQRLANNPSLGLNCSMIREGYRKYKVERHQVYYRRISDDDVEIVRILHERMDAEQYLLE